MKTTDDSEPMDWRERLHSLPSGSEPPPAFVRWLLRATLCLGLFLTSSVFALVSGAWVGLSRGIGPEQTGGALYILPGLILNLLAGAALAALVTRCSASRSTPRLVFYSFTAPALLAFILLAFSFAEHLFR